LLSGQFPPAPSTPLGIAKGKEIKEIKMKLQTTDLRIFAPTEEFRGWEMVSGTFWRYPISNSPTNPYLRQLLVFSEPNLLPRNSHRSVARRSSIKMCQEPFHALC